MGTKVCSDTSNSTVHMCTMSLSMYRGAKDVKAMNTGKYVNIVCGILAGICVSLYQVSA